MGGLSNGVSSWTARISKTISVTSLVQAHLPGSSSSKAHWTELGIGNM